MRGIAWVLLALGPLLAAPAAAGLWTRAAFAEAAKAALAPLPAGGWRSALHALADFAVSRPA